MSNFCNLHNHSNFSFLDGMSRIEEMVSRAKEMGQPALALTDHGVMTGIIPFYKACKKYGVKPVLGMEAYFTRDLDAKGKSGEVNAHLLMLAMNNVGYRNLMKLSTIGHENFYHRPRLSVENLDQYNEGIFITTTCLASPFRKAWLDDPALINPWHTACEQLFEIFEDRIACETQTYEAQRQYDYNDAVRAQADKRGVPTIVTSDCHYTRKEDYDAHDLMLAIQSRKDFDDPNRMKHDCNTLYLHSEKEIISLGFPESEVTNTKAIADMCDVELDFDVKFPRQEGALEQLRMDCDEGLRRMGMGDNDVYRARVDHELSVIERTGFPDYFVVLADITRHAKQAGIPVGPGRGSAAGSLVCKLIGITDVDPIHHGLLFERFINPDRVGLPDIDVDFGDERRSEVVDYIVEKFGERSTAQICTVHKLGVRQAVKDVLRTYRVNFHISNSITAMIPFDAESLEQAMEEIPAIKELWQQTELGAEVIGFIDKLHGMPRQPGTHAAAMVIAPGDITDYIPLMRVRGETVTGYDMYAIEDVGLVKFDILGLKNLTVIDHTIQAIREKEEPESENGWVMNSIVDSMNALDDPEVFKMIGEGKTLGCFQIETSGIAGLCKKLKISEFEDIVQAISLYRPAVLGTEMMEQYLKNRENPDRIRYTHPDLEQFLGETYGIMLFQEQLMQMSMEIGGFTPAEADTLRKGVAKKLPEIVLELKGDFIAGARKKGYRVAEAERMFKILEEGGYGFNRSHAVAYATISYQTAWLKHHYPVEFMVSILNCEKDYDKLQEYFSEARRLGIEVLPIDINKSIYDHVANDKRIRPGLKIVKGVGEPPAETLVRNRKHGDFKTLEDFILRFNATKVNSKVLRALIAVGAMDGLNYSRRQMLEEGKVKLKVSECVDLIRRSRQMESRHQGQETLFNMATLTQVNLDLDPDLPEYSEPELRALEVENLGFYLNDPLYEMEDVIRLNSLTTTEEIERHKNDAWIKCVGIVEEPRVFKYTPRRTGSPEQGCRWSLKTLDDKVSCVSFGANYQRAWSLLQQGTVVLVSGKFNEYQGDIGLIVNTVKPGRAVKQADQKKVAHEKAI
jgi:DNA polymerase-3 subunit alpha